MCGILALFGLQDPRSISFEGGHHQQLRSGNKDDAISFAAVILSVNKSLKGFGEYM